MIALLFALGCGSAEEPAPVHSIPTEPTALVPALVTPAAAAATGVRLVDVRPEEDFAAGHVPGATSVPFEHLDPYAEPVRSWDRERPLHVMSGRNGYGAVAAQLLAAARLPRLSG